MKVLIFIQFTTQDFGPQLTAHIIDRKLFTFGSLNGRRYSIQKWKGKTRLTNTFREETKTIL